MMAVVMAIIMIAVDAYSGIFSIIAYEYASLNHSDNMTARGADDDEYAGANGVGGDGNDDRDDDDGDD